LINYNRHNIAAYCLSREIWFLVPFVIVFDAPSLFSFTDLSDGLADLHMPRLLYMTMLACCEVNLEAHEQTVWGVMGSLLIT